MRKAFLAAAVGFCVMASAADASVMAGPTLWAPDSVWSVSGLSFTALHNTTLTDFTFQNQGQADIIVLTDDAGNVLHSFATPAGVTSNHISVAWALTGGQQYWLLQSAAASNALFASYDGPLVANADIAMEVTGIYNLSINGAVTNSFHTAINGTWFAFNDITTANVASAVPEPATLTLLGVALIGAMRRRKR